MFLRTFADCILTTGAILRKEPDCFNPASIKQIGFDPKVFFEKPKPVAVMTNQISENLMRVGNSLYQDRKFRKHLLTKPSVLKRVLEHSPSLRQEFAEGNATLDPVEHLNLRKALEHLQEEYSYEMILVEAGASTTVPCYSETLKINERKAPPIDHTCDGNPIDTLYLGIFEG